ncbi:DUF3105 domain-containing protein [Micrococcaceae bacterium Sec5.7]
MAEPKTPRRGATPAGGSTATPAAAEPLTIKQQRAARIAEKLAEARRVHARAGRRRRLIIVGAIAAAAAVIISLVVFALTSGAPKGSSTASIEGLQTYSGLTSNHVKGSVSYPQAPPVGGDHSAVPLNCAVYSEPVPNENAVHSLEHGSVWVTYDPARIAGDQLASLRKAIPKTYAILSPYQGLPSPVVASAWGAQVQINSVDDPRIADFIAKYRMAKTAPEPGAPCTGGIDGPGKVS